MGKNTKMDIKKRSADSRSDEPIAKRLRKSTRMSFGIMLESFINNPGLQHIAENILQNLCKHSLLKYRLVNSSWKRILDQPTFWFNKLVMKEFLENSNWKLMIQNQWLDQPIFWSNKLVTKECFGEENVAKFKLGIFQKIQNLESDLDRKGFALGIIKQSIKADKIKEDQITGWENQLRVLKSKMRTLKKIHKMQIQIMQNEEQIRENEKQIQKNEEKMGQNEEKMSQNEEKISQNLKK